MQVKILNGELVGILSETEKRQLRKAIEILRTISHVSKLASAVADDVERFVGCESIRGSYGDQPVDESGQAVAADDGSGEA